MTKVSKSSAHYTPQAMVKGEECRKCKFFNAPKTCDRVLGIVRPGGWCKFWKAK